MPRIPSTSLRILRSLVALVTVWCTGCSGFDPLLAAMSGEAGPVMSCASESMQTSNASTPASTRSASVLSGSTSSGETAVSASPGASSQREFSCGCSSCHAVTLAHAVVPALELATPTPVSHAPIDLVSIGRKPLLPPPERTVL